MSQRPDVGSEVTIIGAGIVGVCSALWLQRSGFSVTLIDREEPGNGCSFGNTAMITPGQVVPMAIPGSLKDVPRWLFDRNSTLKIHATYLPQIAPWLWSWRRSGRVENAIYTSRGMRALHQQTFELYDELIRGTAAEDFLEKCGHIHLATEGSKVRSPELSSLMREAAGVQIEHLSQDDVRSLEPDIAPIFTSGVLMPGNGRCRNPFRLVQALANEAGQLGARFVKSEVRQINIKEGRCVSISTADGLIPVRKLVVAAGIGSRLMTDQLRIRIPLETERGYHVTIKDPGVLPRRQLVVRNWGIGAGPIDRDLRVAGTVEFCKVTARPDWRRADRLLLRAKQLFPKINVDQSSRWMGNRPSISDGRAVLGKPDKFENIYFAFGNGQHGMSAAPMMGKVISEIIINKPPSIDIGFFDPNRF